MSKRKMYGVYGDTGEHDCREVWLVCVFISEDRANRRVAYLNSLAESLGVLYGGPSKLLSVRSEAEKAIRTDENGDQHCSIDYTGVVYSMSWVDADLTGEEG